MCLVESQKRKPPGKISTRLFLYLQSLFFSDHVGRITAPQNFHALIPGTCEYITLQGKKDFAVVTKGIHLKRRGLSWDNLGAWVLGAHGNNVITWAFKSRELSLAGSCRFNRRGSQRVSKLEKDQTLHCWLGDAGLMYRNVESPLGDKGSPRW